MIPSFADPVLDAQTTFRCLLEAMARPGRIERVADGLAPPEGLHAAAAAVLLTLADADTLLWTDAGPPARQRLSFHTGAAFTPEPSRADLLLAIGAAPSWAAIRAGTDEMPQDGATLILQVRSLGADVGWSLTGPGIQHAHRLQADGLDEDFIAGWRANGARFPCGFDVVLTAGDRLAALPRTTRIEEGG